MRKIFALYIYILACANCYAQLDKHVQYIKGLSIDKAGNIYLGGYAGGYWPASIYKIDTKGNLLLIANGKLDYYHRELNLSHADLNDPTSLVLDSHDNLFICDRAKNVIIKITRGGDVIKFAGDGKGNLKDGPGYGAQFYRPGGMAIDSDDNIFVVDQDGKAIRKITPGGIVSTVISNRREIIALADIAIDHQGNMYVVDIGGNAIKKIDKNGKIFVFAGSQSTGHLDGQGKSAKFNRPEQIAIDSKGNLYVGDPPYIKRITPSGMVVTVAGKTLTHDEIEAIEIADRYSGNKLDEDGMAKNIYMPSIGRIACDLYDNVYFTPKRDCFLRMLSNGKVYSIGCNSKSFIARNIPGDISKEPDQKYGQITNIGIIKDLEKSKGKGPLKDIEFDNWGFEKGLSGWTISGEAFNNQPTLDDNVLSQRVLGFMEYSTGGLGGNYWKDMSYPIGHKGKYWIGTHENHPSNSLSMGQIQGDDFTGLLYSSEFLITKKWCDFLIGGGNTSHVGVILQIKQGSDWGNGPPGITSFRNSEEMYRTEINLEPYLGKTARFLIMDDAKGSWGHINVDDFRFFDELPDYLQIKDGEAGKVYHLDMDAPVWGIADTHAHPTHQEGFGRKTIIGNPNAPMEITFSTAECKSIHSLSGLGLNNAAFIGQADPHEMMGWPDFIGFPRFNSKTHQQQHVEFLKRAWQGGLRLFCALAVNNMFLPTLSVGPGNDGTPLDDESVVIREISLMKSIAISQKSWMEIANTPKDARRIIREGKLAIVLGIEVDNFGNFKSPSYVWKDDKRDNPLVALNESNADRLLSQKLDSYFRMGIRQVTPIHYISGVFGGACVFRGETSLVQFAFNDIVKVKGGVSRKVGYSLYEDFNSMAILLGSGYRYPEFVSHIKKMNEESEICMVNAEGLTNIGSKLMIKMMQRGMLIDCEHMSYEGKDNLFSLAVQKNGYPIMSSHTDPHGLSFNWVGTPVRFSGSDEEKYAKFRTSTIRNVAQEGQLLNAHYEQIKNLGGTVGVFLFPYRRWNYSGNWGAIANDCAGSSKTFAQMYLHSLDLLDGKGVAIASDRGMVDFIAPRFGVNAAYSMKEEKLESLNTTERTKQRYVQGNGVKYDRPSTSYYYQLFENGGVEGWEEDAWKALAAWEAGANPLINRDIISLSSDPLHRGRINNFAKGLFASAENVLSKPNIFNGDEPWEQAAMFCLRKGIHPISLNIYRNDAEARAYVSKYFDKLHPIWNLWKAKEGNNPPLRRYKTGNRDWDFNLDGMAHYGMMPDFLQDLRNINMTAKQLTPLFRSAEDYIQMWEKAERLKTTIQ